MREWRRAVCAAPRRSRALTAGAERDSPRPSAAYAAWSAAALPRAWAVVGLLFAVGFVGDRAMAQEAGPAPEPGLPGSAAPVAPKLAPPTAAAAEETAAVPASGKDAQRVAQQTASAAPATPAPPATPATPAEAPGTAPPAENVRFRWSGSGEFQFWSRLSGSLRQPIFFEHDKNTDIEATHFHPKLTATLGRNALAYGEICLTHPSVGVQPEQAWFEYNINDRANIQFGRILIPFGQWNQIHDVYDHKSISYPLMYLGHEETELELDGGPTPIVSTAFTDIGLLFYGSVWPRRSDQLWYGVYLCNGRFGDQSDINWLDLWNKVEDNNSDKAIGGRLVYTWRGNLSLGASYQTGKYDPAERLTYKFAGLDLYYRYRDRVNFRAEYVRNPIDAVPQSYTKEGWWAQVDFPLGRTMEFVATASRLSRTHAQRLSSMERYTIGVNRNLTTALKLKTEIEFLNLGRFVGNPADTTGDAARGTSFDDSTRFKASLVAVF